MSVNKDKESLVKIAGASIAGNVDPAIKRQSAARARLQAQSKSLLDNAELFVEFGISTDTDLETAAEYRVSARNAIDGFEALLRPNIKRLHEAHGQALADLNSLISPLTKADRLLAQAQGQYETKKRRAREEEAKRIEAATEERRKKELANALEEAELFEEVEEIEELQSQIDNPPPPPMSGSSLPVVHRATKIPGGSSKVVYVFDWVDVRKLNPDWLLDQIQHEISTKGDCAWLRRNVQSCVKLLGPRAEKMVGVGSIKIEDTVNVGVRRARTNTGDEGGDE